MFWTTFEMLCTSVGKAPSVVAAEIGIKSTGTVPGWKKGVKPRASALRALADYFGVTVEYLLTGEGQKNTAHQTVDGFSEEDIRHLAAFHAADENTKAAIRLLLAQFEKEKM